MEVNFDLLLSGCNTRCRHCYVNGGPGKNMPTEDALACIGKLDEIAALLPGPVSFTLDNEPINHPEIAEILRAASSVKHIQHYHHGMTTGIALMGRQDRDAVIKAYLDCGCEEFGITLHGSPEHHDEIVRRKGAYQTALEAANYLQACGAKVSVSLMFNRFFPEDAAELDRAIDRLRPAFVWFAVPNYTPHANMPGFEAYRATLEDLHALAPYLAKWRPDAARLLEDAEACTPGAVIRQLEEGPSLRDLFLREQEELYLSVHQDRRLFMGNTGAETACLGDLRTLDAAGAAEQIRSAPGNRDYSAFFDPEALPPQKDLIRALRLLPRDRLYGDPASVICRGLAQLQIPTRILAGL